MIDACHPRPAFAARLLATFLRHRKSAFLSFHRPVRVPDTHVHGWGDVGWCFPCFCPFCKHVSFSWSVQCPFSTSLHVLLVFPCLQRLLDLVKCGSELPGAGRSTDHGEGTLLSQVHAGASYGAVGWGSLCMNRQYVLSVVSETEAHGTRACADPLAKTCSLRLSGAQPCVSLGAMVQFPTIQCLW